MSDPTPPAVSDAMREAVARDIADILLNGGAISPAAFARYLCRAGGPIASEIARLTEQVAYLASARAALTETTDA